MQLIFTDGKQMDEFLPWAIRRGSLKSFKPSKVTVLNEIPSGAVDGLNKTFKVVNVPVVDSSDVVTLNGADLVRGTDYTIDYATGTITTTAIPASGSTIVVDYAYMVSGSVKIPTNDLVMDLYKENPTKQETMYLVSEKIIVVGSADIRISLESNQWDETTNQFNPANWVLEDMFVLNGSNKHERNGILIKNLPNKALRLKVHGATSNAGELFFKFESVILPWQE